MTTSATVPPQIPWNDVQGLVLYGYGKHPYSASLLLCVDDATLARRWLASLSITAATDSLNRAEGLYLNVAFTVSGLRKLGLSEAALNTFPTSFYEGIDSDNRQRILGDAGESEPTRWRWGHGATAIDVLLLIFAAEPSALATAIQQTKNSLSGVRLAVPVIETRVWPDQREHFGFHDGISQPVIEGSPAFFDSPDRLYGPTNTIKAGEFLLGYPNEYGVLPDAPTLPAGVDPSNLLPTMAGGAHPDLGRNGSYLVVRQIAQDVPRFWRYLEGCAPDPVVRERIAAKMIGRWKSGAPILLSPTADNEALADVNDFVYQSAGPDSAPPDCPLGAHIRRSNPRDSLGDDPVEALKLTKRHRLIRRGRSYGPRASPEAADTTERGLLFMCLNASIERQFEFVQQTWINGSSFNGLYDERDPIFGDVTGATKNSMSIPGLPVRRRLGQLGGFVRVRGGAYFFLPGIKALRYLSALP